MSSSTTGGLSTRVITLSLAGGLAVLLALAFLLGDDEAGSGTDVLELPAATSQGEPLTVFGGDPAADPAVGAPAPSADGPALSGGEVSLPTDGVPTILLFLAHWCPHCQAEVPVVQAWLDAGGLDGTGVDLVAVATGIAPDQPNFPPDAWLEREGWTSPTLIDNDGSVADAYGLSAFPFWTVVDGDGEVVLRLTGNLDAATLDQLVADVRSR